jgi:hypothetical protein
VPAEASGNMDKEMLSLSITFYPYPYLWILHKVKRTEIVVL